MDFDEEALGLWVHWCVERHSIWQKRQAGLPAPWTDDPILAGLKFTNLFRVLDPGSQFVFDLETDNPIDTLARLFLYRFTNRPSMWRHLHEQMGRYPVAADLGPDLVDLIHTTPGKIFSGAYMIIPQPGFTGDKVGHCVALAQRFVQQDAMEWILADTHQERFDLMTSHFGVGNFMAYQIMTDWGYTSFVDRNTEDEFVVAGPGARRGANVVLGGHYRKGLGVYDAEAVIRAQQEYLHSLPECPLLEGRISPSLQSIQNSNCEFSKYVRAIDLGKTPRPYSPAHPGPQPPPRLPARW